MNHSTLTPLQKGALLGAGFGLVLLGLPLLATPLILDEAGATSTLVLLGSALFSTLVVVLLGGLIGAGWGYCAGQFQSYRYPRILGVALLAYVLGAFLVSLLLTVQTFAQEGQTGPNDNILLDALGLTLLSSVFLGVVCVPILAGLSYALERWTRF